MPWRRKWQPTPVFLPGKSHGWRSLAGYSPLGLEELSQSYSFSSSHVWMWELDHKESWAPKNWCFWTAVLEKTLERPLDCKEIKPVNPQGNQSWIFIGRTDAEAEAPILWPPDVKNWLIGKIEGRRRRGKQSMRWMASPTWWTWVWASSRSWWWTGKPGMLQSLGPQRVGHDWASKLDNRFPLLYTWKWQNIVNHLYSNKKEFFF